MVRSKLPLMQYEVFSLGLLVYLPKWHDRQICLLPSALRRCSLLCRRAMENRRAHLRKYLIAMSLFLGAATTFAQGSVNFVNTPTTLVNSGWAGSETVISDVPGAYYFALLIAPAGTTAWDHFTFSGVYATNQNIAGTLNGGRAVGVVPWASGTAMNFEIAGWSASFGPLFDPAWISGKKYPFPPTEGYFGISSIGTGVAGGFDGVTTIPPLDLFGGANGIQSGFNLSPVLIPEPSSATLAALGAAALLLYHRSQKGTFRPLRGHEAERSALDAGFASGFHIGSRWSGASDSAR